MTAPEPTVAQASRSAFKWYLLELSTSNDGLCSTTNLVAQRAIACNACLAASGHPSLAAQSGVETP